MTTVVSVINLKGGVGKTQLTVALAEFLAVEHNKKVLVIDLDPQTNATVMLMSEQEWLTRNEDGRTLVQLFKDKLENTSVFSINDALVTRASNLGNLRWRHSSGRCLHLLPSSLDLIALQDRLVLIQAGKFFIGSPVTVLDEAISPIVSNYDFVLIDCPPNLGIITLNGLYISRYYLIPVIPDVLSTYGIPQILNRVDAFRTEASIPIEPLGIVISRYRAQAYTLEDAHIQRLRARHSEGTVPRIFQNIIPETITASRAAEYTRTVNTLKQKYGYGHGAVYNAYSGVTEEFLAHLKS